jgi:translation elongation factor EF-1alpha
MSDEPLRINKPLTLRCATQEVEGFAEKIEARVDPSTLEIAQGPARELKANEAGIALFKTLKPIIAEKFSFIKELGRFAAERGREAAGAGIITDTAV